MQSGEATITNFIVFDLTQSGLESTIYRTRGDHANHYTSHLKLFNIKKNMTDGTGNLAPDLGHARKCGMVKWAMG